MDRALGVSSSEKPIHTSWGLRMLMSSTLAPPSLENPKMFDYFDLFLRKCITMFLKSWLWSQITQVETMVSLHPTY